MCETAKISSLCEVIYSSAWDLQADGMSCILYRMEAMPDALKVRKYRLEVNRVLITHIVLSSLSFLLNVSPVGSVLVYTDFSLRQVRCGLEKARASLTSLKLNGEALLGCYLPYQISSSEHRTDSVGSHILYSCILRWS